jgi:ADP-ribosylglycohydrolase
MTQNADLLLGALVADAACLGLHWIYNVERISEVATRQNGQCAFTPVEARNYEGVKTFAHRDRHNGMFTQIGEVLRLTIKSMNANDGKFDVPAYQSAFTAFFGAGGAYRGFMDGPTRGALANIAIGQNPSGVDDDQTPALTRMPAIMVAYEGQSNLNDMIKTATEITNVNDTAAAYNPVFADVLSRVMRDEPLQDALNAAAAVADDAIKADLLEALESPEKDTTVFAGRSGLMGRACSLPSAGPVMFHVLKHSNTYRSAIENNILAGGDNAGRSILIGAIMARVHGVATPAGVPLEWILQLQDGSQIWSECEKLASSTS